MAVIFNIGESLQLSAFNILQEPIKMLMTNEVEAFEKGSKINQVYVMRSLDKYQEEYRSRTAMDGFKPTEDLEPAGLSDFGEGYRKIFRTQIWTNSFVISKQTMEDNQMMDINTTAVGFIKSYGRTRERFAFAMLSAAVTASTGFGEFEGKKFDVRGADTTDGSVDGSGTNQLYFHNKHVLIDAYTDATKATHKTQSNKFKITNGINLGAPAGVASLLDAIEQVASAMSTYTDEKGNLLALMPNKILIPGGQYKLRDAIEIGLKSKYGAAMGGNGVNPSYGGWEVVELPYLNGLPGFTLADQGIILMDTQANNEYLGAVWHDRTPLEVNSEIDFRTKANVWDGRARFGVGFNNYRAMAYIHTGTDSSASAGAVNNADALTIAPVDGGAVAVSVTNADEFPKPAAAN